MNTFAIVRKGLEYSYVPENWIVTDSNGNENVHWPGDNVSILINVPETKPCLDGKSKWRVLGSYEVIKRGVKSIGKAKKILDEYIGGNDSVPSNPESSDAEHQSMQNDLGFALQNKRRRTSPISKPMIVPSFDLPGQILINQPRTKGAQKVVCSNQSPALSVHSTHSEDSNEELNDYMHDERRTEIQSEVEQFMELDNLHPELNNTLNAFVRYFFCYKLMKLNIFHD